MVKDSAFNPKIKIEPISWFNLLSWARRTYYADLKNYRSKQRKPGLNQLLSAIQPNLENPIFLIGSPRSGTTFLGSCLSHLPELSYHYEPIATKAAARYVYEGYWSLDRAKWFYRTVYAWLMRIHFDGDLRFAEKTPRNCFLVSFLAEIFPNAKFIHIIRDGRDVALSLSKKPWFLKSQAQSGRFEPGGYPYGNYAQFWVESDRIEEFESTSDIHRCIWIWKRCTETALESTHQLSKNQYLELKYESLVFNPVNEANQILDFLQISDQQSCQLFHQAVKDAKTSSVLGWKNQLSETDLIKIDSEAGQLLRHLGYSSVKILRG